MSKRIGDVIKSVLRGEPQKNILELVSHIRTNEETGGFSINQHDEEDK